MSYSANQPGEQVSIYDQVGGEETFDKLTRRFYALVKADPEFSAMYPDFDPFPPDHLTEEQTAGCANAGGRAVPGRCWAHQSTESGTFSAAVPMHRSGQVSFASISGGLVPL